MKMSEKKKGILTLVEEEDEDMLQERTSSDASPVKSVRIKSFNDLNIELLTLQNSNTHTDVRIECQNGYVCTHHSILAAASPTIERIYEKNGSENGNYLDEKGRRKINARTFTVKEVSEVLFLYYIGETGPCLPMGHRNRSREIHGFFGSLEDIDVLYPLAKYDASKVKKKCKRLEKYFIRFSIYNYNVNGVIDSFSDFFISATGDVQATTVEEVRITVDKLYQDDNLDLVWCNDSDSVAIECPRCRGPLANLNELASHTAQCYPININTHPVNPQRSRILTYEYDGSQIIESVSSNNILQGAATSPVSSAVLSASSAGGTTAPVTYVAVVCDGILVSVGTAEGPTMQQNELSQIISPVDPTSSVLAESLNDHLENLNNMQVCGECKCRLKNFEEAMDHVRSDHLFEGDLVRADFAHFTKIIQPFDPENQKVYQCKLSGCAKSFVSPTGFLEHYKMSHDIKHRYHYEASPVPWCNFCPRTPENREIFEDIVEFFHHIYECFKVKKAKMGKKWKLKLQKAKNKYSSPDPTSSEWYKTIDFRPPRATTKENKENSRRRGRTTSMSPCHGMVLRSRSRSNSANPFTVPPVNKLPKGSNKQDQRPTKKNTVMNHKQKASNVSKETKKSTRTSAPENSVEKAKSNYYKYKYQTKENGVGMSHVSRKEKYFLESRSSRQSQKSPRIRMDTNQRGNDGKIGKRILSCEFSPVRNCKAPKHSTPLPKAMSHRRRPQTSEHCYSTILKTPGNVHGTVQTEFLTPHADFNSGSEDDIPLLDITTPPRPLASKDSHFRSEGQEITLRPPSTRIPASPDSSWSSLSREEHYKSHPRYSPPTS